MAVELAMTLSNWRERILWVNRRARDDKGVKAPEIASRTRRELRPVACAARTCKVFGKDLYRRCKWSNDQGASRPPGDNPVHAQHDCKSAAHAHQIGE